MRPTNLATIEQSNLIMPSRNLNYEQLNQKLVWQLKDYLQESKQKWFVVWISWGIDSAVVSTLCAQTGEKVIALCMPIHQKQEEIDRWLEHINWLKSKFGNVENYNIDLTETFEIFKKTLPPISDEKALHMTLVNLRSRLRMNALYALANWNSSVVVWTGNKVEDYGIWFFTKYGDGWVDISPIWALYKSEVYGLWCYNWIIKSILEARPTDGLHLNWATDEDQIWCSYDELEWAMTQYDDWKRVKDFEEGSLERYVMEVYTSRHEWNAHKMQMPRIFDI